MSGTRAGGSGGSEPDAVVVGGGVVGSAVALGMARAGARVTVLDEGDRALRASRGNFALVWVQSKGRGMPEYAAWSRRSARDWHRLADIFAQETGIDVCYSQPGGFVPCLSEGELETRVAQMQRQYGDGPLADFPWEVVERAQLAAQLPDIGPEVVGALYSPEDGHVNSLKLFRALRDAGARHGITFRPSSRVERITPRAGGFALSGSFGEIRAPRVVLCAGLDNARLAPMVGLEAPVRPNKGHIIVTERTEPFLHHPFPTLRQTDEGGVMIGDSMQEQGFDTAVDRPVISMMASRAVRIFPRLARLNVVRSWSALRIYSPDTFPVYDQSASAPGAFLVTCHSGVTLAANHVLTLAPAILQGSLPPEVAAFSARRFHVPAHS